VLAVLYDSSTPMLEGTDELRHFAVVEQIAAGHGLPVLGAPGGPFGLAPRQEGGQPPLYHLVAATLTAGVQAPSSENVLRINPHVYVGQPSRLLVNKNLLLHDAAEQFPWHGLPLAVQIARAFPIVLGAVTDTATWYVAREIFPTSPGTWLQATTLVGANPMFLFICSTVTNDALAIAMASVTLLYLARGWSQQAGLTWVVTLGVLLGLAGLSKRSHHMLYPLSAVVMVHQQAGRGNLRLLLGHGLLMGSIAALVAGWWYLRNAVLYGDATALRPFLDISGTPDGPLTPGMVMNAQRDGQPVEGQHSTTKWTPGETIEDHFALPFGRDVQPDTYRLLVGWYDRSTLQRLAVSTGGDSVPLATVTVAATR